MADARGAGRPRPRGAAKIKLHGSSAHSKQSTAPSPRSTVLPKLKIATSSNNHNEQQNAAAPFSPRAREIPVVLPVAPHPPGASQSIRPVVPALRPMPQQVTSELGTSDLAGPTLAKNAWSTPRSPVPETGEPSSASPSTSALDTFFHVDGSSVRTPARLLSIEETLLTNEQLYQIDWAKLEADADKFLEISATASTHLEGIQADLPIVASTTEHTKAALAELSEDIKSLHEHHAAEKEQLRVQFEQVLAQRNGERAALEDAQGAEKKALEKAHADEIEALQADFQRQIREIEERSGVLESECLQEIERLKAAMANALQCQREEFQAKQDEMERRFEDEFNDLRTNSAAELTDLQTSSSNAYQLLLTSSQLEISELKSSSATEIERLLEASASTLAEVTETLSSELADTKDEASRAMTTLEENYATRILQLERSTAEELAQLKQQHAEECHNLQDERDRRVSALQQELQAANAAHSSRVEQLTARFTAELSATTATLTGEINTLVQHHTNEVLELRSSHADELSTTVAAYTTQLATLEQDHAEKLKTLERDAASAQEAMMQQHESQLRSLQDEAKREKDRIVLRYESDLDFLRRSTGEQLDKIVIERDETIQQLREAHAGRVLVLEMTMRENDKRQNDTITLLEEDLDDKKARVAELETIETALRDQNATQTERGNEETSRWSMRVEEMGAEIVRLEQDNTAKDAAIESLKRDLRVSEDGNQTKSNTLLELTFVIKSRDEGIEKLHAALLDTIQNVNSKTEILELTAETLSSKTKELEDARAALRMESGRLSRVAEDVQLKAGMLEDSELKMETLRLQLENLRLEMKRLQMDMRLQHEHSAGEIELKQGEIRRLHAAQNELKQKNDLHQETIVRLEGSLAATQRQGDEIRRRMELMKVETVQYLDDARKIGDELLENEKRNSVLTKDTQTLHNEKVKLQIQLNNSLTLVQTQREHLERGVMLVEDIHCQYQRRMEMTSAEKDARLQHEKNLLLLELTSLKDTLRQYENVEGRLQVTQAESAARQVEIEELGQEKAHLEARIKTMEAEIARVERDRSLATEELSQQLLGLEKQVEERVKHAAAVEQSLAEAQQELSAKEALIASFSSGASSLLMEKDEALSAIQQRLDDALLENLSTTESLRDQLAQVEQLCQEKDEEISTLEKAFNSESEAHLRDVKEAEDQQRAMGEERDQRVNELEAVLSKERRDNAIRGQAHEEANFQIQYLVATLKAVEDALVDSTNQLKHVQREKAVQGQAHQEANLQIQYLVATLKTVEDALTTSNNQLERVQAEKSNQGQAHEEANFQIQYLVATLKRQEDALAENLKEAGMTAMTSVAEAVQAQRLEVEALRQELATLVATHASQIEQFEAARKQEIENVREELSTGSREAMASAQQLFDADMAALRAEHAKLGAEADEAHSQCRELTRHVAELQQQLTKTQRALTESQEVVRVRKATIDSVRKEVVLLMEMQKQPSDSVGGQSGENATSGIATSGRSMDQAVQLLKQQLETFVSEEFHIEVPDVRMDTQEDLLNQLKDTMRMRYCLSEIGSPKVLSSDDVCASLHSLQQITSATVGDTKLSRAVLPTIESTVLGRLSDYSSLLQQLRGYLGVEDSAPIADALANSAPAFSLLKELSVPDESASVHASRSAALLSLISEHRLISASSQALLEASRASLEVDTLHSLDDLLPLMHEAALLRRRIQVHRDGARAAEEEASDDPTTNYLCTNELQVLLDERHLLLAELAAALEWHEQDTTLRSPSLSVHIVDAVRELMRVIVAFESLSSTRRREELGDHTVAERAHAIVAFVEELRLITQFAQNILDEEADATAADAADHSHSSSASSLLTLRGALTRTPTPTIDLAGEAADAGASQSASASSLVHLEDDADGVARDDPLEHDLLLSGDALAPTDHSDHLRPSLSGALSESLLDISLVMSDHQRILSEAAHWVGKARSMSPRNKHSSRSQHGVSASFDFATELSQLVRDHCALLSLARKLFRLQDPRQDLPCVLQCLAVLSRLTGRLGVFDPSIRASESSESLQSTTDTASNEKNDALQQHERLKASLSVFASMEEMARHLQDYDGFVGQMIQRDLVQDGPRTSIGNIETLSGLIHERLALVEQLRASLGLTNVVEELPAFVESIQTLVAESISKRSSGGDAGNPLTVDEIVKTVGDAFHDRDDFKATLTQMRETLPFASSAESSEELMERLQETLSQCDALIQGKEQAWKMVEDLTEQLAAMDKQHAEEDEVLSSVGNEHGAAAGLSRTERLVELVEQLSALRRNSDAMAASIATENDLLQGIWSVAEANDGEEPNALDARVETVRALLDAKVSLAEDKKNLETQLEDVRSEFATKLHDAETSLEAKVRDVKSGFDAKLLETETTYETKLREIEAASDSKLRETESKLEARVHEAESQLAEERRQVENAIIEERTFITERGIEWNENDSRMSIYARLVRECDKYKHQDQRRREELTEEAAFLVERGMTLVTAEAETHASRMSILTTLFEGQRRLIEEKMERKVLNQQEKARLQAEGIAFCDREALVTRVIDLTRQAEQLSANSAAQLMKQEELFAQELAFLRAHEIADDELAASGSRVAVYETLLQRVEAAKQALVAWEGSPHGDALGCKQADASRETDRQLLEQEFAEATAKAIAAALERQAQQLDFRRAALAAGDAALSSLPTPMPSSKTAAEFVEAFTKRDNTAISMIYRLIRLTTDVLNTSAFSATTNGGGEIPVDLTQAVMTCVKELKALKEYLLQTLEQIARDSGAFALAQPRLAITRESVTERDTAIDFALLLHRDFAMEMNQTLQTKCDVATATIHKLSESLAAHAGDFSDAEAKYMTMEMQLAQATTERATMEAKYATQEEFVQRFVDERKHAEATLLKALDDAKQERADLQAKMEMLDAEKSEAVALARANGFLATPSSAVSTPRTPMSSNGRVYTSVVPTRPDKPRELTSSRLKTGTPVASGTVHKERFVSDLEKETGQRRTTNSHAGMTARRANEWKRHELLTSSTQIEQQFREMNESSNFLSLSPESPSAAPKERSLADQELWYQGVRLLQHVSFFVSVFYVPKQKTFRVEVFNSDSEQQQTIYVTLVEMQGFLGESKRAIRNSVTLEDPARHSEVVEVLFERVKVLGGDSSNLLFAFQ